MLTVFLRHCLTCGHIDTVIVKAFLSFSVESTPQQMTADVLHFSQIRDCTALPLSKGPSPSALQEIRGTPFCEEKKTIFVCAFICLDKLTRSYVVRSFSLCFRMPRGYIRSWCIEDGTESFPDFLPVHFLC